MAEPKYGKICKFSDFKFAWKIPRFATILEEWNCDLYSPDFQFQGRTWYINMYKYSEDDVVYFMQFGLLLRSSSYSPPRTVTYRMSINDLEDKEYWTSPELTQDFSCGNRFGTKQELRESSLKENISRIAPGDALFLHVSFNSN